MNQNQDAAAGNELMVNPPRLLESSRCGSNNTSVAPLNQSGGAHFSQHQVEILKNSICKGASNEEFEIFIMACKKTQLDPFMRQIYAVKRYDSRLKRDTMTIQTGIDGYRLIAERTQKYAPGPKPSFEYLPDGSLLSATAYVKKLTADGTWHIVEAEAYFDEYCQTTTDRNTGEKRAIDMWGSMQRNQLAKCAESLALRKAFPAEMSGIYTKEEMKQAEYQNAIVRISLDQAAELNLILEKCGDAYAKNLAKRLKSEYGDEDITALPVEHFEKMKTALTKQMILFTSDTSNLEGL